MDLAFTVFGKPEPQGSIKAFYNPKLKRAIVTSDNTKLKPWRQQMSQTALTAMVEAGLKLVVRPGAVMIEAAFYFDRPKSQKRAAHKTTKPDVDKTLRAVLDSLTGIAFEDDSQVVECRARKYFGQPARAYIQVTEVLA